MREHFQSSHTQNKREKTARKRWRERERRPLILGYWQKEENLGDQLDCSNIWTARHVYVSVNTSRNLSRHAYKQMDKQMDRQTHTHIKTLPAMSSPIDCVVCARVPRVCVPVGTRCDVHAIRWS